MTSSFKVHWLFPASSWITEVLFWFYQASFYYLLWQISFGLEFRPEMCPFLWVVALFLKRGYSKVSVIASYSCSASSLHSDWAATPVSSKTAGPLKSAGLFFSFSAVICVIYTLAYIGHKHWEETQYGRNSHTDF